MREWGPPPDVSNYYKINGEGLKWTVEFARKSTAAKKPFYDEYEQHR